MPLLTVSEAQIGLVMRRDALSFVHVLADWGLKGAFPAILSQNDKTMELICDVPSIVFETEDDIIKSY